MMSQADSGPGFAVNEAGRAAILAVLLGVAADILVLRHGLTGAGFLIWMVLFIGATCVLPRGVSWSARLPSVWALLALIAAFLLCYRSALVILPMMLLVLLSCSVNWLLQRGANLNVLDYLRTTIKIPVLFLQSLWQVAGDVDPALVPRNSLRGVIKGLVLALPLVLIFALLFASADARFSGYLSSAARIFSFAAMEHIVTMVLMSLLAFGLLATNLRKPTAGPATVPERFSLGREETLIIMGALVLLFLVFVLLQASYLFGGRETIAQTSGLTLAEYARRGFFEMLVVAGLALLVLLAMAGMRCDVRIFRPLAVVLVVFVLIIMVSALQRLLLYVDAFGLTVSRLLALGVMLWLAASLLGLVLTVLRGRPQGFVFGSVMFGTVLLLATGAMNPAAIVTETNIMRALDDTGRPVDVHYLAGLGADALPVILARFDEFPAQVQCQVGHALLGWLHAPERLDWRRWNRSRAAAARALDKNREALEALTRGGGGYISGQWFCLQS